MVFSDSWTEGLTPRYQNLIVEYVLNGCRLYKGIAGFKSLVSAQKFLKSEKGRKAIRKYAEFFFDEKKDTVKMRLTAIQLERAFYNPADIINSEGHLLLETEQDLKKLGNLAYCIDGIETKTEGFKEVEGKLIPIKTTKIHLCNRDKAIEFLVKAFRLFDEEQKEELFGEKSIYSMSDEERKEEARKLLERAGPELMEIIKGLQSKMITDGKEKEDEKT